ncbi:hypothetical protein [Microbacterium sp. NPDC091662]|uniref:hypothetical protein n=1 Tax=Microbacterium sp. NPDC091662 TaxID=3364211 RepID=UPI003826B081
MATAAAPQAFTLKDVILSIEGDDYAAHVSEVTFTPTSSSSTWQGMTPTATFTDVSTATWTCTLAYAQDWSNPDSLSYKLHEEEGASWEVLFSPRKGSGQPAFKATVIVSPGSIGGAVNGWATATVTLGVSGRPDPVPAV